MVETPTHIELKGSRRPMKSGARRLRDVDPNMQIEVTVALKAPALPKSEAVPGQALTPKEFTDRYGAAPADIQAVERGLRSFGLTVQEVAPNRRYLRMSGTAAAIEAAFQPGMAIYHSADQGQFRGRAGTVKVPAELDGLITGVFGLDQRQVARRKAASAASATSATTAPLTPSDLETRYSFPRGDAAGQTIAIAEFGVPTQTGTIIAPTYFPDEVASFCQAQDRPAPNIQVVPVNLSPLTPAQLQQLDPQSQQVSVDISIEVMMDIEIVAALAPGATVLVYFASFDEKGWVDLLNQITAGQPALPVSVSISWGLAEDSPDWSAGALQAINEGLQAAAMQGITVCVSAGDDGSGDAAADRRAHVDFPAASPFALAVGGTMLRGSDEVVWWEAPGRRTNKGGGSTGGGVSVDFQRPSWQEVRVASINPGGIDGRVIPDVSALAGPPFYALVLPGGMTFNGGTSASAPLWAALIGRVNAALPASKRQRFLTPLLYGADGGGQMLGQTVCRDITSGQNASRPHPGKGYSAGPGFDAASGWGMPVGQQLAAVLANV